MCLAGGTIAHAQNSDTTRKSNNSDSLRYPISDRRGDYYSSGSRNPFDLSDTGYIKRSVEFDPETRRYYIVEKIGSRYYRTPTSMSFEDYLKMRAQMDEEENFRRRSMVNLNLNRKLVRPQLNLFDDLFNRIFGNGKIEIKPNGNVDLMMGYQGQNVKNPTLPEQARKYGTLDFDMNAQFNMNANIGDKLKLPINFNTLANFDFENQIRLDYKGKSDEIIKSIEAGNISFAGRGVLFPGAQALFGLKTQLQFGKLFVTGAVANQRSQRQSQGFQGGASVTNFSKKLDDYDENRHFLLAQYFRNHYNEAMATLPFVNSDVQIMRLEMWLTNRTGQTTDSRDIVGLMDLGERQPWNPAIPVIPGNELPDNGANGLYSRLVNNPNSRNPNAITSILTGAGLRPVQDFEKTFARKLVEGVDYQFNRQVGFVSINTFLQPDEVLGVAFQYTYNGRVYQVGEFAQDISLDTTQGVQKVLFLKLLKATSQRTNLPLWDLMMKNVYALDLFSVQREDFKVNIMYQEPSGGEKRILPEGDDPGRPLLRILQLDRLNNRNDPQPDGVFDYVDSFTIQPQQGRIIFPVLEPFGEDLKRLAFAGQPDDVADKYIFPQLYDTIKAIAQQNYANRNRFMLRGQAKSIGGDDIYLNAINIPPGSVTVMAGGQMLQENVDYTIDYNLGKLTIINQAIKSSGIPVNVNLENNVGFGIQNRGFLGLRLDYLANKNLQLGGTINRLGERPFFTKVNYDEDPIRNTMYGIDFNYQNDWKQMTRWLDKLPFYSTKTASSIQAYGEAAMLKPGHARQIGNGEDGLVYLDDFEGTRANIDLRFPFVGWTHASTPQGAGFSEADSLNSLVYNQNRAKMTWYQIEPVLQDSRNPSNPINDRDLLSDPRVRQISNQELFPQRTALPGLNQLISFDMTFYPRERGTYNFDTRPGSILPDGKLANPRSRWGGIMRAIDQTDFETANIEYIEFWLQDPYMTTPQFPNGYTNRAGGKLVLNLGNISEDILRDGRRFYENGLPTLTQPDLAVDTTTVWGKAPINPIQITQAFSNDPDDRPLQDVGFDGMNDDEERTRRNEFLQGLAAIVGIGNPAYARAQNDPSNDNFVNYRDEIYDQRNAGILQRYKDFNGNQGNSPVSNNSQFLNASTLYPDNEDLNRDNTLNENEEYFEYEMDITPEGLRVGRNYITDQRQVSIRYENGTTGIETWYQFRIPVFRYNRKVGNIPDFKSIRFMRWYMKDWQDSVTLRFARMDMVRNNWRQFAFELSRDGTYESTAQNTFTNITTLAVNIEENDRRTPIPYRIPPGIERVQQIANGGINILQNEQSISLQVRNLFSGDARGVFKTFKRDLRQYKRMSMFIHGEELVPADIDYTPLTDTSLYAVVRMGQDFLNNYYEVRIPLKITRPDGPNISVDSIWPAVNNLDFDFETLIALKNSRNQSGGSFTTYYSEQIGDRIYGIYGNPNLGEVEGIFVGIENPFTPDGPNLSAEMWINELRLSGIDEQAGYAATGRVDLTLADLARVSVSASHISSGFGTIEQRVNERTREAVTQFDASLNMDMGKLLPKGAGLSIPVFASINKRDITPEYDPYDQDIKLRDKLKTDPNADSIRQIAKEQHLTQTVNLSNVRMLPKNGQKNRFYNPSNFDLSYNFLRTKVTSPIITEDLIKRHRAVLGYNYAAQPKYWEPFKNILKSKSPWLTFIKDFNLNYVPSAVAVRFDINRQFGRYVPRIVNTIDNKVERVDSTYDKYFNFDRFYTFRHNLTKSINIDFNATNRARVDEPSGEINTTEKKDSIRGNFWKGGRNVSYDQNLVFTYTLPTSKFPFLYWTQMRASYTAKYRWVASSILQQQLNQGNILENGSDRVFNAELDFASLYRKSKWLASLENAPAPKVALDSATASMQKLQKQIEKIRADSLKKEWAKLPPKERKLAKKQARLDKRNARKMTQVEATGAGRVAGKVLTMVKRASFNYSELYYSRIPGYLDSTKFFGNNFQSQSPGLGYILGKTPDTSFLNQFAARNKLTADARFNQLYGQGFDQRLDLQAQLEPFREFLIDLNLDKSFTKNFTQLFKDTTGTGQNFAHLSPYVTGGFSVSYVAFQTLFTKFDPDQTSETFKTFENYRQQLSLRVAGKNPYWVQNGSVIEQDGYAQGYNRYAQEVLVPAFLAAYTGKSPDNVSLLENENSSITSNPYRGIKPLPNWRLNFTGLTQIPSLAEKFSAISINHAYQGRLSMNSFTSALLYTDPLLLGYPGFIDTVSGNYIPFFLLPNLTIQESFEPIIGIDVTTNSQLNARVEYRKSRTLSLSLLDYQLSEVNSTEFSIGASYRKRGLALPFTLPKFLTGEEAGKALQNDITFRLDFSIRDDATSNSRLDQNSSFSTAGQKVIKINPSIDYILNNRINVRLFFDQLRSIPYISTAAPVTNTRAGVQLRISLAQ